MSLVPPAEPVPVDKLGRVHFIGIGGVGMSGIARVLLQLGVEVTGSDAKDGPLLHELAALGATTRVGHDAANVGTADTVVVTSAVREDNPELAEARGRGLRVVPRAAALGSLLLGRRGVAVAGTHGKTTTTSMLTVVLQHAGADPGYVIGGALVDTGTGADAGAGETVVAEADESDGSFLMLSPEIAVVTNVEADHLDNYGGLDEIHANFAAFAERVADTLVVGADDPGARRVAAIARDLGKRVVTYGESTDCDYRVAGVSADGFRTSFTLSVPGGEPLRAELAVPGRHNVLNAAAAVAAAAVLGHDPEVAVAGLAGFTGAARRFELKGEAGGVAVYDSYAHHPTEIEADLHAARAALDTRAGDAPPGRVVAVFQPHLYSRTRIFADEFAAALSLADEVVVLAVYAAREDPEPGVSSELITRGITRGVAYEPDRADAVARAAAAAQPGDIVLTMGAGDVTELGPRIVEALAALEQVGD
ncbi:UDP-N-acetylmuramate--L-alanine ligase [Streptomonospora wellingtoniae]|uniref:UDP-N-acetylmuramate--L-alanine ligase n=1 Tax=Streptomonospora wellingtoniae TaxID=3075544 RepID=A0ABU2KPG8_9ACTN|nr:UDP-N-acetylmuramate--L-alanine ligase [Streptomonospora sp. DSM 45055]MDT0301154.1 UDP-N-acetylmuramate--L-alanine ligase [Streptomonospora sp. DSM 45055]